MNTEIKFASVVSSTGNLYRCSFKGYRLEMDLDKTWLHVIRDNGDYVGFNITEDQALDYDNHDAEDFTENWTAEDWAAIAKAIGTGSEVGK